MLFSKETTKRIIALTLSVVLVFACPISSYAANNNTSLKEITNKVKNQAEKSSKDISEQAKKTKEVVKEKADDAGDAISEGASNAGKAISNTTKKTSAAASSGAKKAKEAISNNAEKAGTAIKNAYKKINPESFLKGWEFSKDIGLSALSAAQGQAYVNSVQSAIDATKESIVSRTNTNQSIAVKSGFVAEEWIADTYNIDAAVKKTNETAWTNKQNGLASVDVETSSGQKASSKYYQNGKGSAKAQATNFMQEYQQYCKSLEKQGKEIPTPEEYLDEHCKSGQMSDIYKSIYEGQTRIIPADQMDEATKYLTQKSSKDLVSDSAIRKAVGEANKETLDNLKDRLESPKGTQSKPLTKSEAQAIAELCEKGEFEPADFGLSTSDLITTKYILKQAMGAGVTAAALQVAFTVGPEIFSIISEAVKTGEIDEEEIKQVGIDGFLAGSEGFIEGSVSCAILTACNAGKFGPGLVNASPGVVGALTVLAVDAAKYGYQLYKGEITEAEYADKLAAEIFASAVALGTTALLIQFLPAVPIIYIAGSMAGAMLGTAGYTIGKEIVMEYVGNSGFEAVVPKTNSDKAVILSEDEVSKIDILYTGKNIANIKVLGNKNGTITVKAAS